MSRNINLVPEPQNASRQDAEYQSTDDSGQNLTLDDLEFAEFHRHFLCVEFSTA